MTILDGKKNNYLFKMIHLLKKLNQLRLKMNKIVMLL